MILSCDVGSLPFPGEIHRLTEGANDYTLGLTDHSAKFFEQTIINAFLDKLKAGITIPAFPQFRDMNEMFLLAIDGLETVKGGYVERDRLSVKPGHNRLPEVLAIEKNAQKILAKTENPFQLRLCVTGPYTLASFFPYRTSQTYRQIGRVLSEIVQRNIFALKQGKVALVVVDEPLFGLVDDPLIDRGTQGREGLLAAWEAIMNEARSRSVETGIHLHRTSDDLFWTVKSLRFVESHVDDPLYEAKATKVKLEKEDKVLRASIAITDFDQLVREKLGLKATGDTVAEAWKSISKGTLSPEAFLEDASIMKERLARIVDRFGVERVSLAGPECGLRGFPTYISAIEYLRQISKAVNY